MSDNAWGWSALYMALATFAVFLLFAILTENSLVPFGIGEKATVFWVLVFCWMGAFAGALLQRRFVLAAISIVIAALPFVPTFLFAIAVARGCNADVCF